MTTNDPLNSGLINTAPGMTDTTPGSSPAGVGAGAPVTSYNPATAQAASAQTSGYDPKAFEVKPNQTVASQLKDIIDSGSPLMQQAEARAKSMMNARGLINSSQAVTAGQDAVISAATPIAAADANTYAQAGRDTTNAQNTALASEAAAKNAAGLQDASAKTSTSQFNTGQTNAALSAASGASNAVALQAQQNAANLQNIKANRDVDLAITKLTNDNRTLLQTSSGAATLYNQMLANLSAIVTNTNMSAEQKATALNDGVQQMNDALSIMSTIAGIPEIQSLLTFGPTPATPAPAGGGTPDDTTQPDTTSPAPVPVPSDTAPPDTTTPPATGAQTPGMIAAKAAPARSGAGNTSIQDIAAAIAAGRPVSDQSWAQAGYGPGGSAPPPGGLPRRFGRMS